MRSKDDNRDLCEGNIILFSILDYQGEVKETGRNTYKLNWKDMANEMYEVHYAFGHIEGGRNWDWETIKGKVECITDPDSKIIVHNKPFPDYYEDEDYLNMMDPNDEDQQNKYYDSIPEYIQLTNEEAVKIFDKRYHGKTIELKNAYETYRVKSARIEDKLIIEKN
ncbi:MAG: hypothetical protein HOJ33_00155 [Gammaproteobacteria bacterium]|nr:hypothetical protein [Gammaproteobacteria bacterium]